jgi:Right handed beta helix region
MRIQTILLVIFTVLMVGSTYATTWTVEKDGSGDFSVIQGAVDAASNGDVIEIGPGRYEEYTQVGIYDVYVLVENKSLTFIGAGSELTIIGPEDPEANGTQRAEGIAVLNHPGYTRVVGLAIENVNETHFDITASHFEMENCKSSGGNTGLGVTGRFSTGGFIRNCQFSNLPERGIGLHGPTHDFLVEDCLFEEVSDAIKLQGSGVDVLIQNCNFYTSIGGPVIQSAGGSSGTVINCVIEKAGSPYSSAIAAASGGSLSVFDSTIISYGGFGFRLSGTGEIQVHGNIVISDNACLFKGYPNEWGTTSFSNNHFLREGAGFFVKPLANNWTEPEYVDMTNNYWGTQDLGEIAEYILDGNDSPNIHYFINFEPIADGPVSSESISLDGIKALYR